MVEWFLLQQARYRGGVSGPAGSGTLGFGLAQPNRQKGPLSAISSRSTAREGNKNHAGNKQIVNQQAETVVGARCICRKLFCVLMPKYY